MRRKRTSQSNKPIKPRPYFFSDKDQCAYYARHLIAGNKGDLIAIANGPNHWHGDRKKVWFVRNLPPNTQPDTWVAVKVLHDKDRVVQAQYHSTLDPHIYDWSDKIV